jgi:4-amino-4-deoxy-L-arabinose transferase-like glycosyltransferase
LFTISTLYYFWNFLRTNSWKYLIFFSISLGIAQLTKQSLTNLFIIIILLSLFITVKNKTIFKKWYENFIKMIVVVIIVLLVINAGFLFNNTGKPLGNYQFSSQFFNRVQSSFSFLNSIPLPLPVPYVKGLDLTKRMDEIGPGSQAVSGKAYILGKTKKGSGFWYFYFIVFFYKTPLLILVCSLVLLAWFIIKRIKKSFWENEFLIFFTLAYFIIFFSFFSNTQTGIRHILMLFPLLYVLTGKLTVIKCNGKYFKLISVSACLYSMITFYLYFPNLISYTNELLWEKKKVYTIMGGSNIDYGQGNYWLKEYLDANPEVKIPSSKPEAGKFIMGVKNFLDLNEKHTYDWLNQNFKPVAHFKYCYLIFDISKESLIEKNLLPR